MVHINTISFHPLGDGICCCVLVCLDRVMKEGCTMASTERFLKMIFGNCTPLYAVDTWQVPDYAKYHITMFDEAKKRARHATEFPKDLQKAYDLGARLVRECE
jgi:hypothetical protein